MDNPRKESWGCRSVQILPEQSIGNNRYGWRVVDNTYEAVEFTFESAHINTNNNTTPACEQRANDGENTNTEPDGCVRELCEADEHTIRELEVPQDPQDTGNHCCHQCEHIADTTNLPVEEPRAMQEELEKRDVGDSGIASIASLQNATESLSSIRSIGSFVCRICHNAEHPERLVSPCLCKGSLTYVHIYCLEHWISTSGKTTCELCQFRYKTIQTLRYTCLQSLRMWYSHSMSRRALQEDCQMFSLLTLVAFGIVGTIVIGIQYYIIQDNSAMPMMTRIWTKSWLLFFLFTTFTVYFINVYMIVRGQLAPWYRWWQSAREIKLILENRKTVHSFRRLRKPESTHLQDAYRNVPIVEEEVAMGTVFLNLYVGDNSENDGRHRALLPIPSESEDMSSTGINNQQQQHQQPQQQQQYQELPQDEQREERQQQDNRNQVVASLIDI